MGQWILGRRVDGLVGYCVSGRWSVDLIKSRASTFNKVLTKIKVKILGENPTCWGSGSQLI